MKRLLLLAASVLLASCGGGGGGGGGNSGGGSSNDAFSLSASAITFNAAQNTAAPAPQVVTVTVLRGTVAVNTTHTGAMFGQTFTVTGATTGQIAVTPGSTVTAGTFVGTITVNGCSNAVGPCNHVAGSPKTITVTYNISGLSNAPAQLDFSATTGTNPASKTSTLSIAGGSVPTWNSSISYSPAGTWLSVTPNTGALNPGAPQVVTFNVNTAGLTAGIYNATVTFTNGGALTSSVAVTLSVGDPGVNFVAPYVVGAGVSSNVIIRGRGFSALNPGTLQVLFNATAAIAPSVVSDTEIRATVPALAAGTYAISVGDGGTPLTSRAALKLLVITPPVFIAGIQRVLPGSSTPSNLTYDAERQAILLIDRAMNRIERYAFDGVANWPVTQAIIGAGGGNPSIALSPDGTELLKTSGNNTELFRINPATLAVISTVNATPTLGSGSLNMIAFANDGGAVGNASVQNSIYLYRYDMLTQTFTALSSQFHMLNRLIGASANGHTLVLPSFEPGSLDDRVYTYDASDRAVTPRGATTSTDSPFAVSRDGQRIILVTKAAPSTGTVFDASFTALGTLPPGTNGGFVFSLDGNFVYAYYPASGSLRKFDLSSSSGGIFTEVVGAERAVATPGRAIPEITISPDGGTLFLASSAEIGIMPAR